MASAQEHQLLKMVAILHADVAGSTALVQLDESLTHTRITETFKRFSQTIEEYGGAVHEIRGDALVAEFSRASNAVCAALAFQIAHTQHLAELNDEIIPEIRVGISLGEVIFADDTVTGPGVIMAQRLEQLAKSSGVCIQQSIYETLPRRLPFDYVTLGEQKLKGFDEPVRAYMVNPRAGMEVPPPEFGVIHKHSSSRRKIIFGSIAIVSFLTIGLMSAWYSREATVEPAVVERMAHPLPDKPSIAVLPFENMSADLEQEYFVDGMTEDLITDLSKVTGLFVISRNSTFAYKGKSPSVRNVAEDLGVRYVLEGSVRRRGDQVRINAQLINATTGGHIWADRYDGSLKDVFGLQDKVARNIVTVLAVQLTTADKKRAERKETENAKAYDAFLKGWEHYLRQRPGDFRVAISYFEKAVELDPQYTHAYAALAATHWEAWKRFWHKHLGLPHGSHEPLFRAEQFLAKAMRDPTALALQVSSAMLLHSQQHEQAIAEAQRAIALDPNDADSYISLAAALTLSGKATEAIGWVERAMRLNPHYPPYYRYQLGLAQFALQQFDKAANTLETATTLNPDDRWSYRLLLATYGLLNRSKNAAKALQVMEERDRRGWLSTIDPLTIRGSAFWLPFKQKADSKRFALGLRRAGVPD